MSLFHNLHNKYILYSGDKQIVPQAAPCENIITAHYALQWDWSLIYPGFDCKVDTLLSAQMLLLFASESGKWEAGRFGDSYHKLPHNSEAIYKPWIKH